MWLIQFYNRLFRHTSRFYNALGNTGVPQVTDGQILPGGVCIDILHNSIMISGYTTMHQFTDGQSVVDKNVNGDV